MKRKIRWWLLAPAMLIVILIITNPGIKNFKDFTASPSYALIKKERNWVIFSIYYDKGEDKRYVGIFMNFFEKK